MACDRELVDTSVFEAAHARTRRAAAGRRVALRAPPGLADAAPRRGRAAVPVLNELLPILREAARAFVELPEGEALTIDPVTGEPWWAFNYYQGDLGVAS